jgi:small GTP-binding protein
MAADSDRLKLKICLAGEPMVGKTSLVRRFVLDEYDDKYIATLGTKVTKKVIEAENPATGRPVRVDMVIWDVMGAGKIRDLLKDAYYHGANGILAVCDVTRPETLPALDEWAAAIRDVAGDVPLILLANKIDLEEERRLGDDDLRTFCAERSWPVDSTSAKTGANVEEAFRRIVRLVLQGRAQVAE